MKLFSLIYFFDKRTLFFYCLTGSLSAIVYFLFFGVLWQTFHINYKIAVSIAYIMSAFVNFKINHKVTFQHHEKNIHRKLIKFLVMVLKCFFAIHCKINKS